MNCETCKERQRQAEPVPYSVHESDMARMQSTIKWLLVALILCIVGLIGMFIYEAQFEDTTTTIEAEQETTDGGDNYAVVGDVNGTAKG